MLFHALGFSVLRFFAFELNLCEDVELSLRKILAYDSLCLSLVWSAFLPFRARPAVPGPWCGSSRWVALARARRYLVRASSC